LVGGANPDPDPVGDRLEQEFATAKDEFAAATEADRGSPEQRKNTAASGSKMVTAAEAGFIEAKKKVEETEANVVAAKAVLAKATTSGDATAVHQAADEVVVAQDAEKTAKNKVEETEANVVAAKAALAKVAQETEDAAAKEEEAAAAPVAKAAKDVRTWECKCTTGDDGPECNCTKTTEGSVL